MIPTHTFSFLWRNRIAKSLCIFFSKSQYRLHIITYELKGNLVYNSEKNAQSIFTNSLLIGKGKCTCRYNFFFFFFFFLLTSMYLFSYSYMDFIGLFFFWINSNHFLIKFHKPDLFNLINELVGNFRKKKSHSNR